MTPRSDSPDAPEKVDAILEAAQKRFAQYGYRRTSMEDVASEAGVARPTLYLYFESKEDIFRSLSQRLFDDALDRARAAFDSEAPVEVRIAKAFHGWSVELLDLVNSWPNAAELLDEKHRIAADIGQTAMERFRKLLADALRRANAAGEIELARVALSAPRAAELLERAAHGLKDLEGGTDRYRRRLDDFVHIFVTAVEAR